MIELNNIALRKGMFQLNNISAKIGKGEITLLLGPNGVGKTMLMETIAGLMTPISGEILFDHKGITALVPEKRNIGYIPQDHSLFPHLTVLQNIKFGLKYVEKEIPPSWQENVISACRIRHLLARGVNKLSGGEYQRVSWARAIMTQPNILLLDEPFSALQETTQKELFEVLEQITREFQLTTLMVHHHFMTDIFAEKSAIMLIEDQQIQQGKLSDIVKYPKSKKIAEFTGNKNIFPLQHMINLHPDLVKEFSNRQEKYSGIQSSFIQVFLTNTNAQSNEYVSIEGIVEKVIKGFQLSTMTVIVSNDIRLEVKSFFETKTEGEKVKISWKKSDMFFCS